MAIKKTLESPPADLPLPADLPEGLELELHKAAWAVTIENKLYVFPQAMTRSEVEKVLRMAVDLRRKN